jgi:hypothetical protein
MKVRESNARKRAVKAALAGTGPDLPGSYAACPSTDPRAMKSAQKKGVVTKLPFTENDQVPNYTFDRWLQKAKEFGDDVNQMRTTADEDEKDLDVKKKEVEKEIDKEDEEVKKKPEVKKPVEEPEENTQEDKDKKDGTWKQLRQIHRDRLSQFSKDSK